MRHLNNAWNSWYSCIISIVLHVLLPCFSSSKNGFCTFHYRCWISWILNRVWNWNVNFLRLEINLKQFDIFIPRQFEGRKKIKNTNCFQFIALFVSKRHDLVKISRMKCRKWIKFISFQVSARFLIGNSCRSIRRLKKELE